MFTIGAAQIQVINGDIANNIQKHLEWMDVARKNGIQALVFPEMSLSGYDRAPSGDMIFSENDSRLNDIAEKCIDWGIQVTVSAPVQIGDAYYISSFHLNEKGEKFLYTKTYLHGGEDVFFTHGQHNPTVQIEHHKAGFAICADVSHPEHAERAGSSNIDLYLVSAFVTESGFQKDADALSGYAEKHHFLSVFSNFCGQSFEWVSAGKSSIWSPSGELLAQLPPDEEGIVFAYLENEWKGDVILNNQ